MPLASSTSAAGKEALRTTSAMTSTILGDAGPQATGRDVERVGGAAASISAPTRLELLGDGAAAARRGALLHGGREQLGRGPRRLWDRRPSRRARPTRRRAGEAAAPHQPDRRGRWAASTGRWCGTGSGLSAPKGGSSLGRGFFSDANDGQRRRGRLKASARAVWHRLLVMGLLSLGFGGGRRLAVDHGAVLQRSGISRPRAGGRPPSPRRSSAGMSLRALASPSRSWARARASARLMGSSMPE